VLTSRASRFFGLSGRDVGRPIQDLEVSYRPLELRTHLEAATAQRRHITVQDVPWRRGQDEQLSFDVHVVPLYDETGELLGTSVTFNDATRYRQLQSELQYANRQLETAYEELQSTNEELETTNEELQSTVEELETTNEELHSTNEELETMNEELQSMNDQLQLSLEAQREQQENHFRSSRYMSAVLGGLEAGVVVVDQDRRVLTWSASAAEMWGVRPDEAEGRPLFDLDVGLPLESLRPLLRELLLDDEGSPASLTLDAVNRRGKAVRVKVTLSLLQADDDGPRNVLLVMEVLTPPEP
jgi:two-component system CheB/CheR fusion protein